MKLLTRRTKGTLCTNLVHPMELKKASNLNCLKLKLPQPKSLDLIVVVTFNLIECRAKMHFIFLILGLFLPKKNQITRQNQFPPTVCTYTTTAL